MWLNNTTVNRVTFAFLCSVEVRRRFRREDPSPLLIEVIFIIPSLVARQTLATPIVGTSSDGS